MEGKTYYDEGKSKVKEVFSMQESMSFDPENPAKMVKSKYKQGPYFMYYESGSLKVSGFYKKDKKTGIWKYYGPDGAVARTEEYRSGDLVSETEP